MKKIKKALLIQLSITGFIFWVFVLFGLAFCVAGEQTKSFEEIVRKLSGALVLSLILFPVILIANWLED